MLEKTTKNNFLVPHDVWTDPKFLNQPASAIVLYCTFCQIVNRIQLQENLSPNPKGFWFFHSIEQLVKRSGLKRKTVIRAKKILNENYFIDIKKGYYVNGRHKSADYFRLNGFKMKKGEEKKYEYYQ